MGDCKTSPWKQFTSVGGDFKILLPEAPKLETEEEEDAEGVTTTYSYSVDRDDAFYSVSYSVLPPTSQILSSRFLLDNFRTGLLGGMGKVKVLGEKNITLKSTPGRAYAWRDKDGITYHVRVYRVKRRLYSLLTLTAPGEEQERAVSVKRFLESFQLQGKYPGAQKPIVWSRFSSEKGRFSVQTPGKLAPQTVSQTWTRGTVRIQSFSYTGDKIHHMLAYSDLSPGPSSQDIEKIYDRFQKGLFEGMKLKWDKMAKNKFNSSPAALSLSQKGIMLQEWPGREIRYIDPSGLVHRTRFYFIYQRLYMMDAVVARENETASTNDINRFLESLQVRPKKDNGNSPKKEHIASVVSGSAATKF
jgi:hypothetical protein